MPRSATNDDRVLVPVPGVDVRALSLRPFEDHVLSRIDGARSIEQLARLVDRPVAELMPLVERLVALGAVRWATRSPSEGPRSARGSRNPFSSSASPGQGGGHYDPADLDEEVDLPLELRREVLALHHRLDRIDHYELLGVSRDADAAAIRRAYFERSKRFHPDAFFGKELGSYKARLQAIFDRLTKAYETLSRRKKRRAYDEYLASLDATREASALLDDGGNGGDASRRGQGGPQTRGGVPRGSIRSRQEAERLRRQRAARRLRSALRGPAPTRSTRHAATSGARPSLQDVAERLEAASGRAVQGGRVEARRRERVLAELSERVRSDARAGRWVDALRSLQRLAVLEPSHELLSSLLPEARRRVAEQMAEQFASRARYEEAQGQWAVAAMSWARVHEGRPEDAEAAWRAARCLLEAQGDVRRAQRLALEAVRLAPAEAEARLVLGRAYRESGMRLNALRELREALRLGAKDPRLVQWIQELDGAERSDERSG